MKFMCRLLVVLAVLSLGTTMLATTATAEGSGTVYGPRNWDDGGTVNYGDPEGGTGGTVDNSGVYYTFRLIRLNPLSVAFARVIAPLKHKATARQSAALRYLR